MFNNNIAMSGGAILTFLNSDICFKENSTTIFSNNIANHGGAINCNVNSCTYFEGNSTTVFIIITLQIMEELYQLMIIVILLLMITLL